MERAVRSSVALLPLRTLPWVSVIFSGFVVDISDFRGGLSWGNRGYVFVFVILRQGPVRKSQEGAQGSPRLPDFSAMVLSSGRVSPGAGQVQALQ